LKVKIKRGGVKCDDEDESNQIVGTVQELLIENSDEIHQQTCRAHDKRQQDVSVTNVVHFFEASETGRERLYVDAKRCVLIRGSRTAYSAPCEPVTSDGVPTARRPFKQVMAIAGTFKSSRIGFGVAAPGWAL
jgi:hypothetical protein